VHAEIKIRLDEEDIEAIVQRVIQALKPLLAGKTSERDEIFTPESLAEYLKVDRSWIYKKVHDKEIPFFKNGKYVRFKKSEIDKWIERNSFRADFPERLSLVRANKKRA